MQTSLNRLLYGLLRTFRPQDLRGDARRLTDGGLGSSNREVGELMTPNPRTCRNTDSLHEAAQIMWETDCGSVPVVDDGGRVLAMITDRDICMAAYTKGLALWQIPVASAASRSVVAVALGDSLEAAERKMREHRVRRLPVIDADGRAVGILSIGDLARGWRAASRSADPAEGVAHTLATLSEPNGRRSPGHS